MLVVKDRQPNKTVEISQIINEPINSFVAIANHKAINNDLRVLRYKKDGSIGLYDKNDTSCNWFETLAELVRSEDYTLHYFTTMEEKWKFFYDNL